MNKYLYVMQPQLDEPNLNSCKMQKDQNKDIANHYRQNEFTGIYSEYPIPTATHGSDDTFVNRVMELFPTAEYNIDETGNTITINAGMLYCNLTEELKDIVITRIGAKEYNIQCYWQEILLTGKIDDTKMQLANSKDKQVLSLRKILELLSCNTKEAPYRKIPYALFPQVHLNDINIERTTTEQKNLIRLCIKALVSKHINLGKTAELEDIKIIGIRSFEEIPPQQGINCMHLGIEAYLAIKSKSIKIYATFTPDGTIEVAADTAKHSVNDIINTIPSLKSQGIEEWLDALKFDAIELKAAKVTLVWNKKIEIEQTDIQFFVRVFSLLNFIITFTYNHRQKQTTIYGRNQEPIEIRELFKTFGVKEKHIGIIPDIILDSHTLSGTTTEKEITITSSAKTTESIKIGALEISLECLETKIQFNNINTTITLNLCGNLNKNKVELNAIYSSQEGFCFEGHIKDIALSDAVHSISSSPGLMNKFDKKIGECVFKFKENEISFAAEVPEITIGKDVELCNNHIILSKIGKQTKFHIDTHLNVNIDKQEISINGGVDISPQCIYLFAQTEHIYTDVLGIEDFNIGNMAVCLSEYMTPPGMGIGFMGEVAFRNLQGNIALYILPQSPGKQLIAINFNKISLLDIVNIFVQCSDNGVAEALDKIALLPIVLYESKTPDDNLKIDEAITIINKYENKNGDYEIQTHEKYSWITDTNTLLKNRSNFKTYELVTDGKQQKLQKFVGMYACVAPKGEGFSINGITFLPGFSFNARLQFLNMTSIVDFTAEPKRGIKVHAEIEHPITLGKLLCISRIEEPKKGPILQLSTYYENTYFYLSAKCNILNLLEETVYIAFGNNKFLLSIYKNILGFNTFIEANSSLNAWKNSNWEIYLRYETSGFTQVTQEVSDYLHKLANDINQATKTATEKLDCAQRTIQEHERNLKKIQQEIDQQESELSNLKQTRYPWYQAYKYIALGARIAAIGITIGAMAANKLTILGMLKAAQGILSMAKEALKVTQKLSVEAIKLLGDITAIAGKCIDWLITIEKVEALLDLNNEHITFNFHINYQLCGNKYENSFLLNTASDLKENLVSHITNNKSNEKQAKNYPITLDTIYGKIDNIEFENLDIEHIEKTLENVVIQSIQHTQVLNEITNDIAIIEMFANSTKESIFDEEDVFETRKILTQCRTAQEQLNLQKSVIKSEDFDIIEKAEEVLRKESGMNFVSYAREHYQRHQDIIKGDNITTIAKAQEHLRNAPISLTKHHSIPTECIPALIEKMEKQANAISAISKRHITACIAEAYYEMGEKEKASKYAKKAIELTKDTYGSESFEATLMLQRVQNIRE